MAPRALPVGDVTLVFTDIEGSTSLLTLLGEGYADVLHAHRRVLREAFEAHGGVEVGTDRVWQLVQERLDAVLSRMPTWAAPPVRTLRA